MENLPNGAVLLRWKTKFNSRASYNQSTHPDVEFVYQFNNKLYRACISTHGGGHSRRKKK